MPSAPSLCLPVRMYVRLSHLQPAGSSRRASNKKRSLGRVVGGLGGREQATQQPKRIFYFEMQFTHDVPHNVEWQEKMPSRNYEFEAYLIEILIIEFNRRNMTNY